MSEIFTIYIAGASYNLDHEALKDWWAKEVRDAGGTPVEPIRVTVRRVPGTDRLLVRGMADRSPSVKPPHPPTCESGVSKGSDGRR